MQYQSALLQNIVHLLYVDLYWGTFNHINKKVIGNCKNLAQESKQLNQFSLELVSNTAFTPKLKLS